MHRKIFALAVIGLALAAWVTLAGADHQWDREHKVSQKYGAGLHREDHGNEKTGQIAAWLFVAANLPVTGTGLTRWFLRRKTSSVFSTSAKALYAWCRDLMSFHYVLNPAAIAIAVIHFRFSWCRSTSLPEWALLFVALVGLTGMMVKFRMVPHPMGRLVRSLHTNPLVGAVVFALLFVGHHYLD